MKVISIDKHTIIDNLNEDSVVFDCGAYGGTFADTLINMYNPHILMYEANTYLIDELNEKYKDYDKVKIFNLGITDCIVDDKKFFVSKHNESNSFFSSHHKLSNKIYILVNTTTIENEIKKHNLDTIDLLKMDIEGSEIEVLNNMDIDTLSKIKQISMELHFHTGITDYTMDKYKKLHQYLSNNGFRRITRNVYDMCYIRQ